VRRRSPLLSPFPEGSDLFSLFQISLENFFDIKFRLWKEHELDPEWIENIPFYEYQIWIQKLNKVIEQENADVQAKGGLKQIFNFTQGNQ
jgi:hypothetical protein